MLSRSIHLRSVAVAFISAFLAFAAQWMLVHFAYDRNWTALFCSGDQFQRPPEIEQSQYVFRGSQGYDGQFYQVIAHDPLLTRHYDRFIDAPRLRYRRILIPALAFLLAGGKPEYIDAAFFGLCWTFIGLGAFSLAQLAANAGRSHYWGFLFLMTPATLAAIERMTVDMNMAALTLACLLAARSRRWVLLWLALAAVVLSRETGLLVVAAVVLWLGRQRNFQLAAALASSILPAAAWYMYVQSHTRGDYTTSDFAFLSAFFVALKRPPGPHVISQIFAAATAIAILALLWMAVRSLILAFQNRLHDLEHWLCLLFAALILLFQNSAIWEEPNGFTRIYSPALLCLLAATWRNGFRQTLTIFAAVALPLSLQLGVHIAGPLWARMSHTP